MKHILLAVFFLGANAWADYYKCPNAVMENPKAKKALEFLQSIAGSYQVGSCYLQLQLCHSDQAESKGDQVVGDLLLTDRHNQSFYVQLDFDLTETAETERIILVGKRMVHYESLSHLPNPQDGRTQNYRLEIIKEASETTPSRVELGVYTSRLREKYPFLRPRRSYWAICQK